MSMLSMFFWLLCAGFALSAAITNILYWYERINTPCEHIPSPPFGVWACVEVYVRTLAGYICKFASHPIGWSMRISAKRMTVHADNPPLLLVHGIYSNTSSWVFLQHVLNKAGYATVALPYHSFVMPLESILKNIDDTVTLLEQQYPEHKPILIGHSLGGMLFRKWLSASENQNRAGGLITLASPHQGSKTAALAPGKLVRNLRPGSDFLHELEQAAPLPIPCVALCSPTDELVLPPCSLLPPENWDIRILPPCSHVGLLFRRATGNALLRVLDEITTVSSAQNQVVSLIDERL